jgi:hypothetical protein
MKKRILFGAAPQIEWGALRFLRILFGSPEKRKNDAKIKKASRMILKTNYS